jgi:hypothetical protein
MAIAHTGELKRFDIFQQMKGHNNKHKKVIKHKIQHRHSAVALLLKAALIQMSDYRLLGASGLKSVKRFKSYDNLKFVK